jgi:hypothetical protein
MNNILITIGIFLAVMIINSLIAFIQTKKINIFNITTFVIVFFLDILLLTAPSVGIFKGTQWNWQGKILETTLGIIIIFVLSKRIKLKDFGFTFKVQNGGWKFFWIITLIVNPRALFTF